MKKVLDVACGGKMFWLDKRDSRALFVDNRVVERQVIWSSGKEKRFFEVAPDAVMDFRDLKLRTNSFYMVVFDPPHLVTRNGKTGWMQKKYGSLDKDTWREDLRAGFRECFRVLKRNGVLIFKWSEGDIQIAEILKLTNRKPLFGHKSGKAQITHWLAFMKP